MVREHGWQLPAHTFQVVAITVFCLLVVAFYAFFAPFLGGRVWMYALIGSYSPMVRFRGFLYPLRWKPLIISSALLVFILYVRCTAINPADPGIMSKFNRGRLKQVGTNNGLSEVVRKKNHENVAERSSMSSDSRSSIARVDSSKKDSIGDVGGMDIPEVSTAKYRYDFRGIFCALFILGDCRKLEDLRDDEEGNGQALYCTLCNAEVHHLSKHCRSCDKCVQGFDHHCRLLNNCVGIKNYGSFIALMTISLVWLVFEAGVGIAVFVRCFVNKKSMETEIINHLGNGFSRAPFAAVVAVCTCVSILACIPLGELLFFHFILIKKGITTYDYVMLMRATSMAQSGEEADDAFQNIGNSPSGSATTGLSGGSFLGLENTGAWCTPPRVFVDHQDEVIPHLEPGMVPSTIDPDIAGNLNRGPKMPKPVRRSAWKLAKLDSKEALKAAAKARASSSVLRLLDGRQLADSELSSSGNGSVKSSVSTDGGLVQQTKTDPRLSPSKNRLGGPSLGSQDGSESGTHSMSSFSSPSHVNETVSLSPLPQGQGLGRFTVAASIPTIFPDRPLPLQSRVDEKIMPRGSSALFRDIKRTSVVWDQEAGRYISVPISASETHNNRPSIQTSLRNYDPASTSNHVKKTVIQPQSSSSSVAESPLQPSEKLLYTGESIFFGGPLLSIPIRESLRNDRGLTSTENPERMAVNLSRDSRFKRDSVSNQLPVFIPGGAGSK